MGIHLVYNFTDCGFNFEIRVGEDEERIGNNKICAKQVELMIDDSANFTCSPALLGDYISINKSSTNVYEYRLLLVEVRVFRKWS